MNYNPNTAEVKANIESTLARYFGATVEEATKEQLYKACAMTVRDILSEKRQAFRNRVNAEGAKRVYYMCMEFLVGRSLKNNLCNLGLCDAYEEALGKMGHSLEELYDCEPDAGLGNGGLGRLAACFMDSLSSLDYPATGFSICYEYGLFRQKIIDGMQVELPDKVAIHINDTHPALCIPELMRILMDEYCIGWDEAWNIVVRTVSYTNHTVLPEALETWNEDLFRLRLPRIYTIVKEINERFCREVWEKYPGNWNRISEMAPLSDGLVKMANIAVIGSNHVNGVSRIHSEILKDITFKNFYRMYPDRFDNVTNGVAHRRWMCYSNPELTDLVTDLIGDGFRKDPEQLACLRDYADDKAVLDRLETIKHHNKEKFAEIVKQRTGIVLDCNSVFDVQIKRLHEYKRQLLSAMQIIGLYLTLKNNPDADIRPQTYIFGAKAAPGYRMAKEIIRLIWCLAKEIDSDKRISEKLKVVFMEDYNVTMAESLIPAAEISEQISLAGKEASGTGCMKLMLNGAITLGTADGANIEMMEEAGKENMFIFGLSASEAENLHNKGYHPSDYYNSSERLQQIVNSLSAGFDGQSFAPMSEYLLVNDPFMCMADFESYRNIHEEIMHTYGDREKWNRMSLMNIAGAGKFAADRSITEYAQRIWHLSRLTK